MMPADTPRTGFRIPALLQGVAVVVVAWLVFEHAFPPVMPRSLMIQFMVITVVGVLLYFSFEDERWAEFKAPILAVLRRGGLWPVRWLALVVIPGIVGYLVYQAVKPSLEAPVELRQVHPAPPSTLRLYDTSYDLTSLENPVRTAVLAELRSDKGAAMEAYGAAVQAGAEVYYQNCFYCHGDLLDGHGVYAGAFKPLPANFQDVGTIAQLQEAFLFWRITTGGPGLPKEGTPWNSAMPVWHEMLGEEDVWNVITFLYDYVGQVPRMWDQETSRAVSSLKEEVESERRQMDGERLYQLRCAVCHGETGAGDGPAAEHLYPRPRDFTLGLFKYKSSPGSLPARDEDLFQTIKEGLEGTGMPGWSSLLGDEQIRSLVPVVKRFDFTATWAPEEAPDEDFDDEGLYSGDDIIVITESEPLEGQIAFSEESVARGAEVFRKACKECHGDQGRGNITSGKRLEDDWGYRIWPRDLTKPWTWRTTNVVGTEDVAREQTIRNIYARLSIGIPGTPMPAHRAVEEGNVDPVSLEDRWHVANYVYSLRRGAAPAPGENPLITGFKVDGALPDAVDDPAWDQASAVTLRLAPNIIQEERLFTPLADALSVRVLYNAGEIAFLLEVNDRTDSRPGEKTATQIQDESLEMFPDAFAIQVPKEQAFETTPVVEKPLYRHGDAQHPTTIWYWNAGSIDPVAGPRAVVFDATGPDQPLTPRDGQIGLTAAGSWEHGRWRVMIKRPRAEASSGDLAFDEGRFIPVSFANWDGSNGEVGSRHTLTTWYWLLLPPEVQLATVYATPAGAALLVFALGLVLVRSQRRKASPDIASD